LRNDGLRGFASIAFDDLCMTLHGIGVHQHETVRHGRRRQRRQSATSWFAPANPDWWRWSRRLAAMPGRGSSTTMRLPQPNALAELVDNPYISKPDTVFMASRVIDRHGITYMSPVPADANRW
jgi:hypothetical protein